MAVFFTRDDCGFSPKSQKHTASTLSVGAVLLQLSFECVSLFFYDKALPSYLTSVFYLLRGSTADDSSAREQACDDICCVYS